MNRIYRVIWNCTLQVFQACSELTRRAGKTSTVNLRKSSGLTTKFSRLTLGVLLALSGSASGASLEVDNDQITNIDTDVAYDAYLVGWYGTGVLNILAGGNASLTTITTSVIGANEDSEGTVNVLGGTWRLYDSGNNARPLNVGQSGTGTLNIKQKGHVDGGYLRLGSSTGGVGTVNVEGEDSVLTTELFEIGSYGTGSLNITDKGYVTSSIVAILGYQAGSNGQVVVEKGGEWLIKNNDSSIEFQIGNQGMGEATIREGGLVTAENTIIGGNATGVGTLNVQDQDSVITVRRLYNGYFGNGAVNISNNGLINNKEYSLVGVEDGSHGVVNVTDKGHWSFLGTGEAFRYIYIGDAGDGELNVSREGKVDSGIITAGMKETGTGNITVKDKNSVITNLGTFDLLSEIGRDSVGAVTLLPENETITRPIMAWEKLTEARLEEVLTAYKADIPLGMIREENDFRISVAGAQEKTALLRIGNDWCIPKGITPTTHIIKLPIGEIRQPNATLDLSQSVDNEYYCLLLAKELGLNVPDAEIIKAGRVRALAVERFDRRWNTERTVLLRLPQEDMCQTFGLPSSVKYESDGGPGIARIMAFLMGSSEALRDRYDFMKFQVFQWLIGATDGHAKNFSVFIQAGGSYRLTPFYDIISAFPVLGGTGIHISDLKLAMGLNASKGKKTAIDKIYPRHFLATAKVLRFPEVQMHEILSDFARMIPAALDNVKTSLPTDFPENVVTAVETNVLRLHGRLSREYGSK